MSGLVIPAVQDSEPGVEHGEVVAVGSKVQEFDAEPPQEGDTVIYLVDHAHDTLVEGEDLVVVDVMGIAGVL